MILQQNDFIVNMLLLDNDNKINPVNINKEMKLFTSNNSSQVLGCNNMKYKIMFENLKIPSNTKFILFQIVLKNNSKFYNPYFFIPIKNENNTDFQEAPGRALSYNLFNNNFNHIWMYFTRQDIERIFDEFTPLNQEVEPKEYFNEYIGTCI